MKIKPATKFKNVYVVQNYGTFRDMFYYLKDAKEFVKKEGTDEKTGEVYYQIYKGNLSFEPTLYK